MAEPIIPPGEGPKIDQQQKPPPPPFEPEEDEKQAFKPRCAFERALVEKYGFKPPQARVFIDKMEWAIVQRAQKDLQKMHESIKKMFKEDEQ
jgi:hypothetical protein